jgi:hypothetical protein
MSKTLILQSHRQPLPAQWLKICLDSVKSWAVINNFDYKFIGDRLFAYVSQAVKEKTKAQPVIATDLARLKALQVYLAKGYDAVVWCDADFLIFSPEKFNLSSDKFVLGREVWVQAVEGKSKKLSVHVKVHNAFMMYRKGNSFLDFYADTAEHLLMNNQGRMPPQFIGPKLLTAIHNVVQCPVLETAGMLSPLLINDIAKGGGPALKLFQQKSIQQISAANLCSSLNKKGEVNNEQVEACISVLLKNNGLA